MMVACTSIGMIAVQGVLAMQHAPQTHPGEMDEPGDQRIVEDQPAPRSIDVRSAPGVAQAVDLRWIESRLRAAVEHVAQGEGAEIARLDVLIVDDARMKHLHERHGGQATTTDVLTFDLRADRLQPVEADIVICADEAARRAGEFKHAVERELLLYCVHGVLHCLGHDDHDDASWRRMHALEDEVLTAIGVGPVFRPPASPLAAPPRTSEEQA